MIYLKVKSNGWKSRAEVTCRGRPKGRFVYEERLKSIELSRASSFYLSSSSSLSGTIRPSGYCVPQPPNIYLNPQIIYLNLSLNSQRPTGLVICIILMHLYHPDTPHDSRRAPAKVSTSDQVRSRPTYFVRPGGHWSTTKEAFVILISYSDFPEDEADVCTMEKS